MGEVITLRSAYRLCQKLPDREPAEFLEIVKKSGDGRVLRNTMFTHGQCGAQGETVALEYIGCDVILRGSRLDALFEELDSMTCLYEFDPLRHRKVAPWEPCIEDILIRERALTDQEKRHFLDNVRVECHGRYRDMV